MSNTIAIITPRGNVYWGKSLNGTGSDIAHEVTTRLSSYQGYPVPVVMMDIDWPWARVIFSMPQNMVRTRRKPYWGLPGPMTGWRLDDVQARRIFQWGITLGHGYEPGPLPSYMGGRLFNTAWYEVGDRDNRDIDPYLFYPWLTGPEGEVFPRYLNDGLPHEPESFTHREIYKAIERDW